MQEIRLIGYQAQSSPQMLRMGTKDSYGTEKLKLILGPEWEGLTITATFVTPSGSTRVLMQEDCLIDVPQEATSQALTPRNPGKIVFAGMDEDEQRITYDLLYLVTDHAPIEGEDSHPTPSEFAQFVAQVQGAASDAKKSATEAADSASTAAGSATSAADSKTQAAQSAADAAKSAQDAAAELEKVQGAGSAALQAIGTAQSTAVGAVQDAQQAGVNAVQDEQSTATQAVQQVQQSAVQAVEQAGTTQVGAVHTAGQAQQTTIQKAGETATQQVQQTGTEQVDKVTQAGDAKLQQITDINAMLPTPTEDDAGKAVVVKPDGSGYALGEASVDAYTEAESDARYAPIEAAIKVSGKGTGLVSLSPTVRWFPQGLKLYGRSWQDGTPSTETEVPIQNAGQSGMVDVTVCGANLLQTWKQYPNGGENQEFTVDNNVNWVSTNSTNFNVQKGLTYYIACVANGTLTSQSLYVNFDKASTSGAFNAQSGKFTATASGALYIRCGNYGEVNTYSAFILSTTPISQYMPYEAQQLPVPTPDGLAGIPVNSGGTWTDENGQQWVSDVVDLDAGTLTQYCGQIASYAGEEITAPYISSTGSLTTGAQIVYVLPEPVTTPLDAETIAAYRALQSYPGTTNILAPDAGIEASAVGDATQIIANLTDKIAALESSATGI